MAKIFYPDFFNEVFGPIMQPGSSSLFAGPSRLGRVARHLVFDEPKEVKFIYNKDDKNWQNLGNMMDDRGLLGGSMDFLPDDERLFHAHEIARKRELSYTFCEQDGHNGYDDYQTIEIESVSGEKGSLIGASVGGGMIRIRDINGYSINWQSDTYGILVENVNLKNLKESLQNFTEAYKEEIVQITNTINSKENRAYFIETSKELELLDVKKYFSGQKITLLPAVLPVVTTNSKKPQLFTTVEEWRNYAEKEKISFVDAAIEYEKSASGWTREEILAYFEKIAEILNKQIHALEILGYENVEDTPLLPIYGKQWNKYLHTKRPVSDGLTRHIITHAYSVNAKIPGVVIVPGPMGTGGGYLYSALDAVKEEYGYSHEKEIEALIIAAALGAIAYTHTNPTGDVGCVGESGVCCAMASGAIAYLCGGDGVAVENAASMALQANIGIPCDPIPGGLEFPCITRTIRAAVTAPLYAEMALTGLDPLVSYHECLQAIEHNYRTMPSEFLCSSKCGFNCTPTAARCKEFLKKQMEDKLSSSKN